MTQNGDNTVNIIVGKMDDGNTLFINEINEDGFATAFSIGTDSGGIVVKSDDFVIITKQDYIHLNDVCRRYFDLFKKGKS